MVSNEIPTELRYTEEHEWVLRTGPSRVRVGITDYAQSQLGDVVFVQLPAEGDEAQSGETFGEVESTKSVSDIFAPLNGRVVAVNADLDASPELVNSDPYGEGWLVELELDGEESVDDVLGNLLDAAGYAGVIGD